MKIYTRTGDQGETSLFAGGRVSKSAIRLHVYGTVDELNAILGVAVAAGLDQSLSDVVLRVQAELFVLGSDLATPLDADAKWIVRIEPGLVSALEQEIDQWQAMLPPLRNFILPGGVMGSALLHQARTVCRRAERWLVDLKDAEEINAHALSYLNRLSDWLFVAARVANATADVEDLTWRADHER